MRLTILFHETTYPNEVTEILRKLLPDEPNVESIHHVPDDGVNIATYNLPWRKDPDLVVGIFPEGTPVRFISQRAFSEWQRKFPDARTIQLRQQIPTLEETNPIQHPDPVLRTVGSIVVSVLYVTFSLTYRKDLCELLTGYPENWLVLTDHSDGGVGKMFHIHAEEYDSEIESSNPGVVH